MEPHKARISWQRGEPEFTLATYNRDHEWHFEGGQSLGVSAAPAYRGNPDLVDPEQAFTASLSSCHMLTFLAMAANKGLVVESYRDDATGELGKNADGRMAVTQVTLRPEIEFSGEQPSADLLDQLHDRAHKMCFIANSVTTKVKIEQR